MCDSFVALGNSTANGSVLLAKSADTEINEAEHVLRVPGRDHGDGAMVPALWCVIHDPGCSIPGIVCAEHCPRAASHGPRGAFEGADFVGLGA